MMKSVRIKNKGYLIFLALLFIACKNNERKSNQKNISDYYFFDVVGNSNVDTLVVENSSTNKFNKSISIILNGKKSLICELNPRIDSAFITTSPKIESIYLEANDVQTTNKGFRLLSKNTDVEPEYFFMDLHFNKEWYIKDFGFLHISSKTPFICKEDFQKSIKNFKNLIISPKEINQIYFKGTYCR